MNNTTAGVRLSNHFSQRQVRISGVPHPRQLHAARRSVKVPRNATHVEAWILGMFVAAGPGYTEFKLLRFSKTDKTFTGY